MPKTSAAAMMRDRHPRKQHIMNKNELISQMALDAGLTKVKASAALASFMETVVKALKSGKKVTLVGFGTFSVTRRAARKGRNPATGETVRIKAKKVGKFKPSNELNARL